MTTNAMIFFIVGATVLWGGLAITLLISFKNSKN